MQIGFATAFSQSLYADPMVRAPKAVGAEELPSAADRSRSAAVGPLGPAPGPPQQKSAVVAEAAESGNADLSERPPEEKAQIAELKRRDQEVRLHEGAHLSAGGGHVRGGASYTYQPGPDGRRYAVGGEVSIDAAPVANNPEATVAKMQAVRRAALAPARPSGQDISVAARATQAELQARMQVAEQAPAATRGEGGEAAGEGEETGAMAPSSPADAVGPIPVSTGALLDAYA